MATLDFTQLFRSTVGFDRLHTVLSLAMQREEGGYPPYNIEKHGDDAYRIVMAVAGFGSDDIDIVAERNRLTVRGSVKDKGEKSYLHRGIATRSFERHFDLADFVKVAGASLDNGLLTIDLQREIPEAMKPRKIEIGGVSPKAQPAQIDKSAA
jgi:molecular chaperone IbpA